MTAEGGGPANVVANSAAENPVTAPGGVISFESSYTVAIPTFDFLPRDPRVILESTPDVPGDPLRIPTFIIEAFCVSRNPKLPQNQTSEERPDNGDFTKSLREFLSKNAMLPIQNEVDKGGVGSTLDRMYQGRTPLPSGSSLSTAPKPVEDGLRNAKAEGA